MSESQSTTIPERDRMRLFVNPPEALIQDWHVWLSMPGASVLDLEDSILVGYGETRDAALQMAHTRLAYVVDQLQSGRVS